MKTDPQRPEILPTEVWRKERDKISRSIRSKLHLTEVNPGPHASRLRYDYILTAAEVTAWVEEVMRRTERAIIYELRKRAK